MPKRKLSEEITNEERALLGLDALLAFSELTEGNGLTDFEDLSESNLYADEQTVLADLLANLMHRCQATGIDFRAACDKARDYVPTIEGWLDGDVSKDSMNRTCILETVRDLQAQVAYWRAKVVAKPGKSPEQRRTAESVKAAPVAGDRFVTNPDCGITAKWYIIASFLETDGPVVAVIEGGIVRGISKVAWRDIFAPSITEAIPAGEQG